MLKALYAIDRYEAPEIQRTVILLFNPELESFSQIDRACIHNILDSIASDNFSSPLRAKRQPLNGHVFPLTGDYKASSDR
jgi:hypothetical protein